MTEEFGICEYAMPFGEVSLDTAIYADGKVATYFLACVAYQGIVLPVSDELGRPEHDEDRWVRVLTRQELYCQRGCNLSSNGR